MQISPTNQSNQSHSIQSISRGSAADYETVVQQLYVAYFGRPADTNGLASFSSVFSALQAPTTLSGMLEAYKFNASIRKLVDGFGSSQESLDLYGSNSSNTLNFVNSVYRSVLGRDADTDGLVYWASQIDKGSLSRGNAALTIASAAANNVASPDSVIFQNKVDAAIRFTDSIDTVNELSAYNGLAASQLARTMLASVQLEQATNIIINNALTAVVNLAFPPTPVESPPASDPYIDSYSMSYFVGIPDPSSSPDLFFP